MAPSLVGGQLNQTFYVVDQIQKSHLDLGAVKANRPNLVSIHGRLGPEDVFDPRSHFGLVSVRGLFVVSELRRSSAFFLNLALYAHFSQHFLVIRRPVGVIGINRAPMALLIGRDIQEFIEDLSIVDVGRRNNAVLDQLGVGVRVDLVLVTIMGSAFFLVQRASQPSGISPALIWRSLPVCSVVGGLR